VEDNAHGLLGSYRGRPLGSLGTFGCQSFHETKNIICGEGGALIVNDPAFTARAEIIREKGTDRSKFFRGEIDRYTWVDVGSSFLMSELSAAFLYAQLEAADLIQAKRRAVWWRYHNGLHDWAVKTGAQLPIVPAHCEHPAHLYHVITRTPEQRKRLIESLGRRGIHAVFHYVPLHLSRMGRQFGGHEGQCPVTEDSSERLVRLPFYNDLMPADQDTVLEAVVSSV